MKKKQIIGVAIIVLIVVGLGITLLFHNEQNVNRGESSSVQGSEEKPIANHEKEETGEQVKSEPSDILSWFKEEENVSTANHDKFPYQIPNSTLSIRAVKSYNGVFIEDGSDKDVSGIAAIILDNKGTEDVEYAKIILPHGQQEYIFEAKTLAAGATMVVQESTGAKYVEGEYGEATVMMSTMETLEMSEKSVKVFETEQGAIQIENISGENIPCVRIFYKFYLEDIDVSVGGITYTSKITDLQANEVRTITPSHYDKNASRIMMVRTYDTY